MLVYMWGGTCAYRGQRSTLDVFPQELSSYFSNGISHRLGAY